MTGKEKRKTLSFEEVKNLIKNDDREALKTAIEEDALDINIINYNDGSALNFAVNSNKFEIMEILASHPNIDFNAKGGYRSETPLISAVKSGNVRAMEFLIEKGADVPCSKNDGSTALMIASENKKLVSVEVLLKSKNCSPNAKDSYDKNALMYAIRAGSVEIVKLLAEVTDLSQTDGNGFTALHLACEKGSLEMVKVLVEKSTSELNKTDIRNKESPLLVAVHDRFIKIADYLIEKGASLTVRNVKGYSVFEYASKYDDSEAFLAKHEPPEQFLEGTFKLLIDFSRYKTLKAQAAKCIKKYHNCSDILKRAIGHAFDNGKNEAVKSILSGIYEVRSDSGPTDAQIKKVRSELLIAALKEGRNFVIDYFLQQGLDPNEAKNGDSYLIQACCKNNARHVRSLLKLGADPHAKNIQGFTPLLNSAFNGCTDVFLEIFDVDNDLSQRSNDGLTPFLAACKSGNLVIIKALIKAGACLTDVDNQNRNCLHFAAKNQNLWELLFEKLGQADFHKLTTAADSNGNRPVDSILKIYNSKIASDILKAIPYLAEMIEFPTCMKIQNSSQEVCLICRDDFVNNDAAIVLPCKHVFHEDCYSQWDKTKEICPYCQKPKFGVKQL